MANLDNLKDELQALHDEVCELYAEYEELAKLDEELQTKDSTWYHVDAYRKLEKKRKEFNDLYTKIRRLEKEHS